MKTILYSTRYYSAIIHGKSHIGAVLNLFPWDKISEQKARLERYFFLPLSGFFILPIKSDSVYKSCFIIKDKLQSTKEKRKKTHIKKFLEI